jgi:transaldolase
MKFFVDSASIEEIREAAALGLLDGVTTNPSLVAKEGRPFAEVAREICQFVQGPVSLEVVSLQSKEMISEGKALRAEYGKNVVVKIPMTPEGLKATKALSSEGIPVNVTLVFQPVQALLAAKAGAAYVSPFVGRHDDISQDGMQCVRDILQIFENYDFPTEVLAASLRHPLHVLDAAKAGAHVATLPLKVIQQLALHPLTDIGLKKFMDDWAKSQKK